MKPEIIDDLAPENKKLKPIELTYCLQDPSLEMKNVITDPKDVESIRRIARLQINKGIDVFIVHSKFKKNYPMLMLGHWNDGVAE